MRMEAMKKKKYKKINPNTDDSIKPDFKVFWLNKSTRETGNSTFFTYEYGAEIINAVFNTMYPEREILDVKEFSRQLVS